MRNKRTPAPNGAGVLASSRYSQFFQTSGAYPTVA